MVNTQKSAGFLYTNNKLFEKDIKKTISLTILPKVTKFLGIHLTIKIQAMQDLYFENQKRCKK